MRTEQKAEIESTLGQTTADDPAKKRRGFTMVEDELLSDPSISPQAKIVLIGLKRFARRKTVCFPKIKTLAIAVGMSQRTVARYLVELRNVGRVVSKRRIGTSSIFTLGGGGGGEKTMDLPEYIDPNL